MKKKYIKPYMLVVLRKPSVILCASKTTFTLKNAKSYSPDPEDPEDEGFD